MDNNSIGGVSGAGGVSGNSSNSGGAQQGVVNRKWVEFVDKMKKDEFTSEIVRALETEKSFESY